MPMPDTEYVAEPPPEPDEAGEYRIEHGLDAELHRIHAVATDADGQIVPVWQHPIARKTILIRPGRWVNGAWEPLRPTRIVVRVE